LNVTHVLPPSVDFHDTVPAMMTTSWSFGCGSGIVRSPPPMRPTGRVSVVIRVHDSPASSLR
jgi:hypothetical protein